MSLTTWPDPEQWTCCGCGLMEETPRRVTPLQLQNGVGFWTPSPRGWLCLIMRVDSGPIWVCSESCALRYFDARG